MQIPPTVFNVSAAATFKLRGRSGRHNLHAVRLERDADGTAHAVATDGRMILVASWIDADSAAVPGFTALVGPDAWKEGERLAKAGPIHLDEACTDRLRLASTSGTVTRTVEADAADGTFPEWRTVIPAVAPERRARCLKVNAGRLAKVLEAVADLSGQDDVALALTDDPDVPLLVLAEGGGVNATGAVMPTPPPAAVVAKAAA